MNDDNVNQNVFLNVIKGVTVSTLVTLVCLLIFAVVIKISLLDDTVVKWVNQLLKIFSVFIGVFFCVKGKGGVIKGGMIGLFSTALTYLIFALISGQKVSATSFVVDCVFALIVGAIVGIMAVNRKKD